MEWHYETIAEYPNGGKDVIKVVDVPDPPTPMFASQNYEKNAGMFEYGKSMYALKAIANGEQLIVGQNVSELPISTKE